MKKIIFCFSLVTFLLFAVGCTKENEKTPPPINTVNKQTLTYISRGNGSIKGLSIQTVDHGSTGSEVMAVPDEHYHFVGWSDGVTTVNRTDRNVTEDLEFTANFAIDQYTLTYTAGENGTIKGASRQSVDHNGTGSEVTAVPAGGYHFLSWSDGVPAAERIDSNVTSDLSVKANFALNQYTLTYIAGENGSIEGTNPQSVNHGNDGNAVTAIPNENYHFIGWSDGIKTTIRTDKKVTVGLSVTANFAIDQYTLTYTAAENGSIKGEKSQKVNHEGAGSTISAVPDSGYHFKSWSDGINSSKRTDSNIVKDLEVTATFAVNQYTLSYTAGKNGTIEGINLQTVDHGGDAAVVTAVADKGYHFVTWSDGATSAQRIDLKITGGMKVNAVFAINTYTIGGNISGLIDGTDVVLQNNGTDDLIITANGYFQFADELINASKYEITVLTQPSFPNQICTVTGGTGTVSAKNVTDISVTCAPVTYTIGGTVSGLSQGDKFVLRNNDADDIVIMANSFFTFPTPLDDGSEYLVTVYSQPKRPNWTCELENASGFLAGMDINDIAVDCFPKVVLQAIAGIRKAKLNWNSQDFDFDKVVFNLCLAQENIPIDGFSRCQDLKDGVIKAKVNSPLTLNELTNDISYWFQLEALYENGRQTLSEVVKSIPFGGLNDSGIDWCADNNINYETDGTRLEKTSSCDALVTSFPGQDSVYGRDALAHTRKLIKKGSGATGFDFTKICNNGAIAGDGKCPPNPMPGSDKNNWGCTRDNVTGLTWEIKTDSGVRSKYSTYSWYNDDKTLNGGEPGLQSGGSCEENVCDTQAYIQAINNMSLCGVDDWRLPTKRELLSIVDNGRFKPATDSRYFPNTLSSHYWSSSPYAEQDNSAWQVNFLYGEAFPDNKSESKHILLVRGRTVTFGLDNP